MKRISVWTIAALLAVTLGLPSCGKKGDLETPGPETQNEEEQQ